MYKFAMDANANGFAMDCAFCVCIVLIFTFLWYVWYFQLIFFTILLLLCTRGHWKLLTSILVEPAEEIGVTFGLIEFNSKHMLRVHICTPTE